MLIECWMFQCSNVQMFKCSNAPIFKCSNVQMFKCSIVQMFKCWKAQMFKCSNVHMFKYQMKNVNKVKLLSERTSGVLPVIFFWTTLREDIKYYFADFVRKGGRRGTPRSITPFLPKFFSVKGGRGVPPQIRNPFFPYLKTGVFRPKTLFLALFEEFFFLNLHILF